MNEDLEKRLKTIEERNRRVEAEKAWEVGYPRTFTITAITYVIAGLVLLAIGNEYPWRNALIPAIGYFLSTQSLPFIRRKWVEGYLKKHD